MFMKVNFFFFFFQAEDGIRDYKVTGVQTCALPIWSFRSIAPPRSTPTGRPVEGRPCEWLPGQGLPGPAEPRLSLPVAPGIRRSRSLREALVARWASRVASYSGSCPLRPGLR